MPPIEVGAPRAIGAVSAEVARKSGVENTVSPAPSAAAAAKSGAAAKPDVATSAALDPGQAPVDTDRVAEIRKAVESGTYPLIPARIADAMIAASMFLRSAKA